LIGNNGSANGGSGSGGTTGSTIAFNGLLFDSGNTSVAAFGTISANNGYSLQFNKVDFKATPNTANWSPSFGNGNAPIIIAGTTRQLSGCTTASRNIIFLLSGSSTANAISGTIMDAVDYPANTNTTPLQLEKIGTGTWTLSGFNTNTGTNSITAGILALTHDKTLPLQAVINVTSPGVIRLDYSGTMRVASFRIAGVTQPKGIWGSLASTAPNKTARITGSGFITTSDQVNPNDPANTIPIDKVPVPSEVDNITDYNRLHY
jgi:autotransporter-associated beta strand protein